MAQPVAINVNAPIAKRSIIFQTVVLGRHVTGFLPLNITVRPVRKTMQVGSSKSLTVKT
jgi:hypothetical protein